MAAPDEAGEIRLLELTVARNGQKFAMVARPGMRPGSEGRNPPYAYMTEGLLVAVDPQAPGGLVVVDRVKPHFKLTGEQGIDWDWGVGVGETDRTEIRLDFTGILRGLLGACQEADYDARGGVLKLQTANSVCRVYIQDKGDGRKGILFKGLIVVRRDKGGWIGVMGSRDPQLGPRFFSVTKESVLKLGLPIREMPEKGGSTVPKQVQRLLFPSASLFKDHKAIEAAQTLESAGTLGTSPPTSPPASQASPP
jgi:hypothetical protein